MSVTAIPYATQAEVKDSLAIPSSDSTHDAKIDEIIVQVSQGFDSMIGESLTSETITEFYSGNAIANGIPLRHMPTENASSRANNVMVVENGVTLSGALDYLLEAYPSRILLRTNGSLTDLEGARWLSGERNIIVTYPTAFTGAPTNSAGILQDIRAACREESHRAFVKQNISGFGDGSRIGLDSRDSPTGTNVSYSVDDYSESTKRILNYYKNLLQSI